ncbi:carbohydrate ABC transporter permease [Kribbella sp. NPDC055071]
MKTTKTRLLTAALLGVAVVGNAAFAVVHASTDGELVSARPAAVEGIAAAVAVDPSTTLVATLGNEVAIVRDGQVAARQKLDGTVGGIAADGSTYYAGTSLGTVYTFDSTLHPTSTRHVPDAVSGLRAGPDSTLVTAHGAGVYGENSSVDVYPAGTAVRVGSTVTALDATGDSAVYGTVSARVGMLSLRDGRQAWQVTIPQPVTSIASVPQRGWVLVGDKTGGLNLLDKDGNSLGTVDVGDYPITAIAYDAASGQILIGDQHGAVSVLDGSGRLLVSRQAADSAIRALTPTAAVPQSGPWSAIDVSAARGIVRAEALQPWWIAFDVLLAIALIVLLALTGRRRATVTRTATQVWRARLAYLMVAPTVLLVVGLTFYPALSAFYYSFTDFNLTSVTTWVGLNNYHTILTDDAYFWAGVKNMVIVVAASIVKTIVAPLLAAELVYWLRNAFHQYLFRTLFVLSAVVPTLVVTLLWKQIFDPDGLVNKVLSAIGLGQLQHAWLGEEATALGSVIAVGFPYLTAFPFLIFLGGLLTIGREVYDSAAIDGAGRWQRFFHVDLAYLRPQFRIVTFFAVVGSVEGFASIFLLTNGGPGTSTYVPALEMYSRIGSGDLGYASAIGVILFVVIVAATMFILRFRRSAMEVEA